MRRVTSIPVRLAPVAVLCLLVMMVTSGPVAAPSSQWAPLEGTASNPQAPHTSASAIVGPSGEVRVAASEVMALYEAYTAQGAAHDDWPAAVAADANGCVYVAVTTSGALPTTFGAYQASHRGLYDVWVAKYNDSGLVWATYLGGEFGDYAGGIDVDGYGNVHVVGWTDNWTAPENGFPTTAGAYQTAHHGNYDGFYAVIAANGSTLIYSTLIGGSMNDRLRGVLADQSGTFAVVVGMTESSTGYPWPTTSGALNTTLWGSRDAVLAFLDIYGHLNYSTYLGGNGWDDARGLAGFSPNSTGGYSIITGLTDSTGWYTAGAHKTLPGTAYSGFISYVWIDFGTMAGTLDYQSYLGGGQGANIWEYPRVDYSSVDDCAVIATSTSSNEWDTSTGAPQLTPAGDVDLWMGWLQPHSGGNDLIAATYWGADGDDRAVGITVDGRGLALVAGQTSSTEDWPSVGYRSDLYGGDDGTDITLVQVSRPVAGAIDVNWSGRIQLRGYDGADAVATDSRSADPVILAHISDTSSTSDRDVAVLRLSLPDDPVAELESRKKGDVEPGDRVWWTLNANSSAPSLLYTNISHVSVSITHNTTASAGTRTVSTEEPVDDEVPWRYQVSTHVQDNETGTLEWLCTVWSEDGGQATFRGTLNSTGAVEATGEESTASHTWWSPSTPIELYGWYIVFGLIAVATAVGAWLPRPTDYIVLATQRVRLGYFIAGFGTLICALVGVAGLLGTLGAPSAGLTTTHMVLASGLTAGWAGVAAWRRRSVQDSYQGLTGGLAAVAGLLAALAYQAGAGWQWVLALGLTAAGAALLSLPRVQAEQLRLKMRGISLKAHVAPIVSIIGGILTIAKIMGWV
ncbi:MAG: hypothetical protein DRI48_00510 [Chloroflexi bacterium]|nr:MAG: hypothetical protein DRI48_00510 [Chloroflexota bacterium]